MANETAFNGVTSETFAAHSETIRGSIRYELVKRNLGVLLSGEELSIADVGGGTAIDALWLAGLGHQVTIVDPAEDQLSLAAQKLDSQPSEITNRIDLLHGTVEDLRAQKTDHSYDLVLSHGVAMYLDDPEVFIGNLALLVKPNGYVSLLEKGFYGARNGLVREGLYTEALHLDATGKLVNHQKREVWAFKPETLHKYLAAAGAKSVEYSGVRITRDFDDRLRTDVPADEFETIVSEEYEAGKRTDLRAAAPMLHFIALIG